MRSVSVIALCTALAVNALVICQPALAQATPSLEELVKSA